jgi:hypothetical protein
MYEVFLFGIIIIVGREVKRMFLRPTGSVAAWNFYVDDVDVYVESQATNLDRNLRNLPNLFSMDDATLPSN